MTWASLLSDADAGVAIAVHPSDTATAAATTLRRWRRRASSVPVRSVLAQRPCLAVLMVSIIGQSLSDGFLMESVSSPARRAGPGLGTDVCPAPRSTEAGPARFAGVCSATVASCAGRRSTAPPAPGRRLDAGWRTQLPSEEGRCPSDRGNLERCRHLTICSPDPHLTHLTPARSRTGRHDSRAARRFWGLGSSAKEQVNRKASTILVNPAAGCSVPVDTKQQNLEDSIQRCTNDNTINRGAPLKMTLV